MKKVYKIFERKLSSEEQRTQWKTIKFVGVVLHREILLSPDFEGIEFDSEEEAIETLEDHAKEGIEYFVIPQIIKI